MIIGVPKEIKDHETRVGLRAQHGDHPARGAATKFWWRRHAGEGSSLPTASIRRRGRIHSRLRGRRVERKADLVVKVKEPQPAEYPYFRPGLILFTYLHLAPLAGTDRLPCCARAGERRGL